MKYKYSGRVFKLDEFKFIDFDIGTMLKPALGMLKTDESVTVVFLPDEDVWVELMPLVAQEAQAK